jgi:perosamine synthetase
MIARKQLDVGWKDLIYAGVACMHAAPAPVPGHQILTRRPDAITCLSVRSGLDLLLTELALPCGSEILVSAITIPDFPRIIRAHDLVPVPVDVDPETLTLDEAMLARVCTRRARALIVAHLFGARVPTDSAVAFCRKHGLLLLEDCAQAFTADDFTGNPESDVRMFSFGPIKTATALGGGVLLVRNVSLLRRLEIRHQAWPVQSTFGYARRVLKLAFFKPLLAPHAYAALVLAFRTLGGDHDQAITRLGRSFAGPDFFQRLRQRPCAALIRMLEWRLSTYPARRVQARTRAGEQLRFSLTTLQTVGASAMGRTHWLFPVRVADPEQRKHELWAVGFDATRGATSLFALPAGPGQEPASRARAAMAAALYVPVEPGMSPELIDRLAASLERRAPVRRSRLGAAPLPSLRATGPSSAKTPIHR